MCRSTASGPRCWPRTRAFANAFPGRTACAVKANGEPMVLEALAAGIDCFDFAAHASWHPSGDALIGGFASYGGGDGTSYGTFGVEAQRFVGDTRLYGQLGFLSQLGSGDTSSMPYVEGVPTRYCRPNVAISGFAGGLPLLMQNPARA